VVSHSCRGITVINKNVCNMCGGQPYFKSFMKILCGNSIQFALAQIAWFGYHLNKSLLIFWLKKALKEVPGISNILSKVSKFQHHNNSCSKCDFFLKFKSNFLVKRVFMLNVPFAMAIMDLISCVQLGSFVMMLPKYLKHSTFTGCFQSIIICCGDGCFVILIALVLF
jgi:hypothetical protein